MVAGLLAGCQPETPGCIQDIGVDISNFPVHMYNNGFRSQNGSFSNFNYSCPQGGTATISGSVTPSTITYNVTINMTMCGDNGLTLNGSMSATGSGGNSTISATALRIFGMESSCNADPIDATCEVLIITSDSFVSDVSVCDLTYP